MKLLGLLILSMCYSLCCAHFATNETLSRGRQKTSRTSSPTSWTDPYDDDHGIWFKLLEDYTTSSSDKSSREGRLMPPPRRYIPTSGFYITKRMGEAMELEPHRRPPGKVISPLMPPHQPQHSSQQSQSSTMHGNYPTRQNFLPNHQQLREVSETDLYLLGAIEKLVYRVDYMEHRLRRTEQLVYYLMEGNKQKEEVDPCPKNFTRVGESCYHISGDRQVNWKSANTLCKQMNAHLAEFVDLTENEEMVAFLLNHPDHRGRDFWLGALNPGLLWIWSNSAKPVNPNTNLTSIANSGTDNNSTAANEVDDTIKINSIEIQGSGRCLRLSYNPAKHTYFYYGQECTTRHHFLCQSEDKTLQNKIKKLTRELDLDDFL